METRLDQLREKAVEFNSEHPIVWELFCKFTFQRIYKGFENYSARGIFHRIRWETEQAVTADDDFKLNDHLSPFYARRFMKMYPEHDGFFRTRRQISEDEAPVGLPELLPAYFEER